MTAARRLVEARLGREPQDMLEAAVVLEAWAGVGAEHALASARSLMPRTPRPPLACVTRPPVAQRPQGLLREGGAFLLTVPAIALWTAPLAASLGAGAVERALRIALPLALALQWMLHSRYLGRPDGVAELVRRRRPLLATAATLVALTVLVGSPCAGLLTITWAAGGVLVRRGGAAAYTALVLGATAALLAGAPPLAVLGATAAATAFAATRGAAPGAVTRGAGGRGVRTACAGVLGAGLGVLLVADSSLSWTAGSLPAVALLPAAAGGFAGGARLWRLHVAVPRALSGIVAGEAVPSPRGPLLALAGAGGLVVGVAAAGSGALLALVPEMQAGVLAGFVLVALATLLAGLLESFGKLSAGILAVLAGSAAELAVGRAAPFAGAGLVAGGALAVTVLLPAVVALLARPDRTLATAAWIP